ncbi:hypothetical protein PAGU2196_34180 [Pseudomonas sp. PAGU 2196]|uniref:HEPN domain-containing protein n=1 Tax=Pseudomonas sp. PAGU 2196 TaxID=2793997 RepID=UPI001EDDC78D|nr:HEPN domain-containing protein [Pseudomonas sp. PAGU 2196]GHS82584.1 hypothetical protein PAGU2196_34180 [Pseudomonas sp. PAGU 2196]
MNVHPKKIRIAELNLGVLLTASNLKNPYDALKSYEFLDRLAREVATPSGSKVYFTDQARSAFESLITIVFPVLMSELCVLESDVDSACRKALGELYEQDNPGVSFDHYFERARNIAYEMVAPRRFYTTLHGLEFDDIDEFDIGNIKIQRPLYSVLEGSDAQEQNKTAIWNKMQRGLWVSAELTGSMDYAESEFFDLVRMVCGLLAVSFTTVLEYGGLAVRLMPSMAGRSKPNEANWFSYDMMSKKLRTSFNAENLQALRMSAVHADGLVACDWFQYLVSVIESKSPSEIEILIKRGLYWFFDAQTDCALEMKLVKFWSCIECFFSIKEHVPGAPSTTEKIVRGTTACLTYGSFRFSPPDKWNELEAQIKKLYDLRCVAVHDGAHGHVAAKDVAVVSKWASWVLLEIGQLARGGFDTRRKIKAEVDRMHNLRATKLLTDGGKGGVN